MRDHLNAIDPLTKLGAPIRKPAEPTQAERFKAEVLAFNKGDHSLGLNRAMADLLKRDMVDAPTPLVAPEVAQASDGWIEWKGGEVAPIKAGAILRFRDQTEVAYTFPHLVDWSHLGDSNDIVAYRVLG